MNRFMKILWGMGICIVSLNAGFLDNESTQAIQEKKLILISIESDDCPYCQKMRKDIFDAPAYRAQIEKKYIHVSFKANDPSLPMALRTNSIPANAILSPANHTIVDAYVGYIEPTSFMSLLDNAYKEVYHP